MVKKQLNPIDAHVGARLRLRRIEIGMSAEEVAVAISTDVEDLHDMENGIVRVGPDKLMRLSRLLQVDIGYFFKEQNGTTRQYEDDADLESFLMLDETPALIREFIQIVSTADRLRVVEFAGSLTQYSRTGKTSS